MNQSPFVPAVGWVMPFVALLLSIAILPLAAPHFWESNSRKLTLSALLGLPVVVLYSRHAPEAILHTASDYLSFMVLLGSLFIISGGVMLDGDIEATSAVNAAFLGAGALLASVLRLGRARAPTRAPGGNDARSQPDQPVAAAGPYHPRAPRDGPGAGLCQRSRWRHT